MLRHRLPGYRRLVREGRRAEGLIVAVDELQSGTIGHSKFRMRIRARLPGGAEPEITSKVDSHELRGAYATAGDTVPLRFDPAKPERIDIDLPEWRSRLLAASEAIEAEYLRRGETEWNERKQGLAGASRKDGGRRRHGEPGGPPADVGSRHHPSFHGKGCQMDVEKLGRGEKIAGVSAVVLFIFMFFDWFSVSISGGGGAFDSGAVGSGSAWDALDNIPVFLVITILVALAVVALRMSDSTFEPPISANAVVAVLGAISVLLILYRIIDTPGGGSFVSVSVDVSPTFGIFISLIAAAGITYGGYLAMKKEGTSFGDLADRFGGGGRSRATAAPPRSDPTSTPPPSPAGAAPPQPPDDTPPTPPPTQ